MKLMPKSRKGQGIGDLPGFVQIFVVAGIFLGVGALILSEFVDNITATQTQAIDATRNATEGLLELSSFLPINN